ncbi:ATP-dependent Clp protease proteolytic subunit [Elysia marginata]|uniref:ATP-dependent Clp protease proteolytic subunit n=1 Tax=Elysia marginata TaxID=1093978 RepID=A0AAV4H189_9GAST|nr:ATP-dependent Clp protease proteolytic subunit [Elysia marginata]
MLEIQAQGNSIKINGVINDQAEAMEALDSALENADDSTTLYINSPGGCVFTANEIVNRIKAKELVPNVQLGALCASAGTFIACSFGKVTAYENTRYMIHKPQSGTYGNEDDIEVDQKLLKSLTKDYLNVYAQKTGKKPEDIESIWVRDHWMTANEAKEQGFIDEIITNKKSKNDMNIQALATALNIDSVEDEKAFESKILSVILAMKKENTDLRAETESLKNKLAEKEQAQQNEEVEALVAQAKSEGKLNADNEPAFRTIAKSDSVAAKTFLDALKLPPISAQIETGTNERKAWTFSRWAKEDPKEGLYKNNEFLNKAANADQYVLQGKVVHIPQAGAPSGVVRNRTTKPASVVQRGDTDVTYALDEYTANPTHISNADTVEVSYDKRQSVLKENLNKLKEVVADWMLYHWAPVTANLITTTGDDAGATAPSATGDRKLFTKEDLKKARLMLNKANVAREGRVALLPSEMMDQLLNDPDLKRRDSSMELDMKGGVVTRLYGFDLMERSNVLIYHTGNTVKKPYANGAAGDRECALVWQEDAVERALGQVKFFEKTDDPQYYGDIYSFLVRMGGRKRREDGVGVLGIVQG